MPLNLAEVADAAAAVTGMSKAHTDDEESLLSGDVKGGKRDKAPVERRKDVVPDEAAVAEAAVYKEARTYVTCKGGCLGVFFVPFFLPFFLFCVVLFMCS